jgi:hypothetical protein
MCWQQGPFFWQINESDVRLWIDCHYRQFQESNSYQVGPLIGAAAASLVYDNVVFPSHAPEGVQV